MKQSTLPVRLTPPALATQIWTGKQDYNLMALYQLGAEIVKVDIHRDTAYSIQSRATVAVYDVNDVYKDKIVDGATCSLITR